jgi:hypothetical protein
LTPGGPTAGFGEARVQKPPLSLVTHGGLTPTQRVKRVVTKAIGGRAFMRPTASSNAAGTSGVTLNRPPPQQPPGAEQAAEPGLDSKA